MDVSIIVPAFNEGDSIKELYEEIKRAMSDRVYSFEVIIIDDGSTDRSHQVIKSISEHDSNFKYLSMVKNCGKSVALNEGFKVSCGKYIVTMDADLQDDPNEIHNLISKLEDGFDVVTGWKKERKDPLEKRIPSKVFNLVLRVVSGLKINDFNCGLKIYKKDVVKHLKIYGELHRFIPMILHFKGFNVAEIPVKHRKRKYGKSKYGLHRYFVGFMDLLTIILTVKFKTRPLHLFGGVGVLIFLVGFLVLSYLSLLWFLDIRPIEARPLFFLGILSVLSGIQFVTTGLIAELITKNDPNLEEYILKDTNINEQSDL
ncbi:MAG: glycosyltransferase family 2 protein [Bacteriovoracaceae bacterium]